jgi:deazaflavin-dependent oxidoreductase (nitroreductase family)
MFFRMPIQLYRWHLGWLLGGRFLLLEHRGRKTGLPRQVVVEVVRHDLDTDCYVIASGFGEKSDWLRNLIASPDVSITVGRRRLHVHGQRLDPEAAQTEMLDYARRHPRAAKKLAGYMGFTADGSADSYRTVGRTLPFIRLCPRP